LKPTYEIILDELDLIVRDLQEEVLKMKEILLSAQTSSDKLVLLKPRLPGQSGRIDLSGWTKEAQVEATNYSEARGIKRTSVLSAVVIKARGKSIADSYLVLRLGDVFDG
jgi:hypothetical protein